MRCLVCSQVTARLLLFVIGVIFGVCLFPEGYRNKTRRVHAPFVLERSSTNRPQLFNCDDLRLLFVVMSSPDHKGARKRSLVRMSWPLKAVYKDPPSVTVTLKFVLGTLRLSNEQLYKLATEQSSFGDLLLLDNHHDTYEGLLEKVRQTIQWVDRNNDFDYLVKTDDDVIILLDKFTNSLRHTGCPERLYLGRLHSSKPKTFGKWKEIKYLSFCNTYMRYAAGLGYVLGRPLVRSLMKYPDHLRQFVSEDVSIGLWMMPFHLTRKHEPLFAISPAACTNKTIIIHQRGSLENIERAAIALVKTGRLLC